jgi:hypothetical protein
VPVREFHLGPYETVVGPGELLAEVGCRSARDGSAYEKVAAGSGDWSVGRGRRGALAGGSADTPSSTRASA